MMEYTETTGSLSKLVEIADSFTELKRLRFDDKRLAYHTVVALVHQLCTNIALAEKVGYSRTDIEGVLEPVWEIHARSPFFRRMQTWPRGYPGDYETIEYLCECVNKARPRTVEYFI